MVRFYSPPRAREAWFFRLGRDRKFWDPRPLFVGPLLTPAGAPSLLQLSQYALDSDGPLKIISRRFAARLLCMRTLSWSTCVRRVTNFVSALVSFAGGTTTLVLAYGRWYPQASRDGQTATIFLSLYVVALSLTLVWREWAYATKSRYAEILSSLEENFLILQKLVAEQTATVGQIEQGCIRLVTNLAKIFSLTTSTACSVCIKVIEGDPKVHQNESLRPKVRTLCRNDDAEKRRKLADISSVSHWVDQNTDFYNLHQNAGTPREYCFFSNNIPGLRGYRNSSFEVYGSPADSLILTKLFPPFASWPLPYKSTIVVPILPRAHDAQSQRLYGYLCVDSRSRGAFSRRYDPELLTGIAECLCAVVKRYCDLVEAKSKEAK